MSTYTSVVISPETTTSPVLTSVSQATRPFGSSVITASRTPSEIWSQILSGWPSVTDSEVNRCSFSPSLLISLMAAHGSGPSSVLERQTQLGPDRGFVARDRQSEGLELADVGRENGVCGIGAEPLLLGER